MKKNMRLTFKEKGFPMGRLISGSKFMYRDIHPNNLVIFNANIIDVKTRDNVWCGDLDITFDAEKLIELSDEVDTEYLILTEHDSIDNYVWSTKTGVSEKYKEYFNDNLLKKTK